MDEINSSNSDEDSPEVNIACFPSAESVTYSVLLKSFYPFIESLITARPAYFFLIYCENFFNFVTEAVIQTRSSLAYFSFRALPFSRSLMSLKVPLAFSAGVSNKAELQLYEKVVTI